MYAAVASVSRETEEDEIDVYQAVIDRGMELDVEYMRRNNREKCLQRAFDTLKSKTRPKPWRRRARRQQSDVEVREVQSETEVTQMLVNQGHTELECTEADLEAAVGMMAAATQARV